MKKTSRNLASKLFLIWLVVCLCLAISIKIIQAQGGEEPSSNNLQPTLHFSHLTVDDGLPHNNIGTIYQDKQGFMWFGSGDGLSKFDGYTFTNYRYNPNDPNSLSNNAVSAITEDANGMLWIATAGRGANRFDPHTETFTRFLPKPDNGLPNPVQPQNNPPQNPPPNLAGPDAIGNASLSAVFADDAGNILFGGTPPDNLSIYNTVTQSFTHYNSRPNNPFEFNAAGIFDFVQDANGHIWIAADNALVKYIPATKTLLSYPAPPPETHLSSLLLDNNNALWVGGNSGLYKFNPQTETFTLYQAPNMSVTDILQSHDETLILSSRHNGIFIFNPQTESFINHILADPTDPDSLSSNQIGALFQDNSGVIWIGTIDKGLNLFDPRQTQFAHYKHQFNNPYSLSDNSIEAIGGNNNGLLWLGTNNELNQINQHTGELTLITPEFPQDQAPQQIHTLHYDRAGMLWLGMSERTLLQYNPQSGQFIPFILPRQASPAPTQPDNAPAGAPAFRAPAPPMPVVDIAEDAEGNLWVAVHRDGVFKLNQRREVVKAYQPNQRGGSFADIPDNISSNDVRSLYIDRAGNIWIGYQTAGISRLNPANGAFKHYFLEPAPGWVEAMYEDKEGIIWLATRQGLIGFNPASETTVRYTEGEGLPSAYLNSIMADNNGNLWLASQQGLSKFNPQTQTFKNYGPSDGLQGNEFNQGAYWQDSAGQMYFGGTGGLTAFNPLAITDNPFQPPVILTQFSIANEAIHPGQDSPLSQPIWETDNIILPYNKNIISFEFSALNYAAPQNNRYRYQLQGVDEDWIMADSAHRQANYTNLDPGAYTFRVQGSNNHNIWSEHEVALNIIIQPPWWETAWFRLSLFIIALGLLIGGYNWRTKSIKQRNLELENQVTQRTQELALATQAAESANQAKSVFLANMSHELRSPLNAILGFAQVMQQSETLNPTDRENISIIARSGEHLLNLINQVLDLSKIEAGRITLNPNNFNLLLLLTDLENMFTLKAQEKNLQLLFEHHPQTPPHIRTDEIKLRQVLINLLNNALKFTAQGGVSLRVKPKTKTDQSVTLQFEVEDSGAGIAPTELEHIFTPFVQTESGRQAQEGTGLGLPISRQFVQLMGGDLAVTSQVGNGTVFSFTIQAEIATPPESKTEQPQSKGKVIALEPNQPRYRILVVDDKAINRQLLLKLLAPLGFELEEAENGQQALEIWRQFEPHLIWMDMRMPVMDGYTAAKEIKAHTKGQSTAIIALTASSFEEERAIVLSAGCDDFMRKPFREAEIFEKMHQHIGVKFVYERTLTNAPNNASALQPLSETDLAPLPLELLTDLEQAITALDINLIETHIAEINALQPELASDIQRLNNNFKFDELLALIQEAKTNYDRP